VIKVHDNRERLLDILYNIVKGPVAEILLDALEAYVKELAEELARCPRHSDSWPDLTDEDVKKLPKGKPLQVTLKHKGKRKAPRD
jgi:hypothetical protein